MIKRYHMALRYNSITNNDWIEARAWPDGVYMRADEVIDLLRELKDALPDVLLVTERLQEELE